MWRKQFKSKHQVWDHVRTKRLMCPQIWVLGNFMTFWHFTLLWLCRRFSLTFHWNFDHNLHQFILTYIEKCTRSECQKAFSSSIWYDGYVLRNSCCMIFQFWISKKIILKKQFTNVRKRVMKITWHQFTILLDIDRLRKEISNNCKLQKVHQCYLTSLVITYFLSMEVDLVVPHRKRYLDFKSYVGHKYLLTELYCA